MPSRRLVPRALYVFDGRAGIGVQLRFGPALPSQLQNAVAQAAQEHPVVRNENHGPVELGQRSHYRFDEWPIKAGLEGDVLDEIFSLYRWS